ncbi:hypothetical protein ABZ234_07805 [Nocardiopsis sp. NPDC006198]|uniref:hypothetical protein n=1 Tax=Nocardiopsis sp. NPDC006198 TaxID=3154472 RepID=UPI0033A7B8F8
MEPISALILAGLLTWGTAGGGIKDTAAILKGQTPPSVAYRTARMAHDEKRLRAWEKAMATGKPLPPALEPRRIRIKDLARHWWEDALDDADAWRAERHLSRPERKKARKERHEKKKALVKKGYTLIKDRGEKRFGTGSEDTVPDPAGAPEGAGAAGDGGEVPDNVVPLHGRKAKDKDGAPPAEEAGKPPAPDSGAPPVGGAAKEDLAEAAKAPAGPEEAKEAPVLPGGEDKLAEALDTHLRTAEDYDNDIAREAEAARTGDGEPIAGLSTDTKGEISVIDLSDSATLDNHLRTLDIYRQYLERIAADMDSLAAGMANHRMGTIAVSSVSAAGAANSEAGTKVGAVRVDLARTHTVVADARAAAPDAADGEYLTRGR